MSRKILCYAFLTGIIFLIGCSSGNMNPVGPMSQDPALYDAKFASANDGHFLWGAYTFSIDPDSLSVEILPNRVADPHIDVTKYGQPPLCDDCIKTVMTKFDPITRIAEIEVTLRNPTKFTGYDVRGILILNEAGFDMQSADGWTSVFDDGIAPYFNPFMRYAKLEPDGAFGPGVSLKEIYMVYIPKPPKYSQLVYVIDAVFPKNSDREPYNITGQEVNGPLWADGSNSVTLTAWVFDRNDDTSKVTVECSEVFNGTKDMTKAPTDPTMWTLEFGNEKLAVPGTYDMTIEAFDPAVAFTLRDKVQVNVVEKVPFWMQGFMTLANGNCSFDVAAADGGVYTGGGYLVNSMSQCSGFYGMSPGFFFPTPAVNCVDISPGNTTLQPYPPVRYDSALGGGLAFSNSNTGIFEDGLNSVPLSRVVVCLPGSLLYQDDLAGDDSAHYPAGNTTLAVADVCDGFQARFYILWVENGGTDLPILRCYTDPFTTKKQRIGLTFPAEFVGSGDGKFINDAASILAIDANEIDDSNVELYILEKLDSGAQIEVFNLYTDLVTFLTEVTSLHTYDLPSSLGEACDLELLPPNHNYIANPDKPSMVVLFRIDKGGGVFGGYLSIYDAATGALVEPLGSPEMTILLENVQHMDVNNSLFSIVVTSKIMMPELNNMIVMTFTYI